MRGTVGRHLRRTAVDIDVRLLHRACIDIAQVLVRSHTAIGGSDTGIREVMKHRANGGQPEVRADNGPAIQRRAERRQALL